MVLHVFNCSRKTSRTGITADIKGANLPSASCQGGKWEYWKTIDINHGDEPRMGVEKADVILAAIDKDGYYINDTVIKFKETVLPK